MADASPGNSWLTVGLRVADSLNQSWRATGGEYHIPFVESRKKELQLVHTIQLPPDSILPDTFFLYMKGVAWSAEVELDQLFLGITDDPFGEYLFPIYKEWISPDGQSEIHLRLKAKGAVPAHYPPHFCGMLQAPLLLRPDSVMRLPLQPEWLTAADSVVAYAPWPPNEGFGADLHTFLFALGEIRAAGGRNLWFPYEPPGEFLAAAARLGFRRVSSLKGCKLVAWYNYFPAGEAESPRQFWKDAKGDRTAYAGNFYSIGEYSGRWMLPPNQNLLVIFLLIPLVGMALFRAFSGQQFYDQFEFVSKAKIHLDLIRQNKFLRGHQTILLNLLRTLILATAVASMVYYVQCSGEFDKLNVITSESLVYQLVHPGGFSFPVLILIAFGFITAISFLKYSFVSFVSFIFRLGTIPFQIQNLDVFSSFPFNSLLVLPAWFIFYLPQAPAAIILVIWQLFFLLFFARKVLSTFQGLSIMFSIRLGLKVLYICTLEILPWLILL